MSEATQQPALPALESLMDRFDRSARRHHERLPMLALAYAGKRLINRLKSERSRVAQLCLELEYTTQGTDRYREILEEIKRISGPAMLVAILAYGLFTLSPNVRAYRVRRGGRRNEMCLVEQITI